jgi:chemotaxis methyl-accepting protein methylase
MGLLSGSYLLGTDCREEAIDLAKRGGHFDRSALRNVPAPLVEKYFLPRDGGYGVCADIRYATRWRTANLLFKAEPGFWDLILFRNTAMYFCPDVCTALWERLESALRPGGLLVLGKAERPVGAKRLTMVKPCIYRRSRR